LQEYKERDPAKRKKNSLKTIFLIFIIFYLILIIDFIIYLRCTMWLKV
jgi:hypothetical protein